MTAEACIPPKRIVLKQPPADHTLHPNDQPPTEQHSNLCSPLMNFLNFLCQRRVVGDFLLLFTDHFPLPRHRETHKCPLLSRLIHHSNIWMIMLHLLRYRNAPIPPDSHIPILRHPHLIRNLFLPHIRTLAKLQVHQQPHQITTPLIFPPNSVNLLLVFTSIALSS